MPPTTTLQQGQAAARTRPADLVLTHVFDAPRALVWEAWTRAEHLARWWGPDHFTVARCEVDARQGGAIVIDIQGPDGKIWRGPASFTEFVPPERLAFLMTPLDDTGTKMFEALTAATFTDQGGKTLVRVDIHVMSETPLADEHLAGMREGWTEQLEHLAVLLPNLR